MFALHYLASAFSSGSTDAIAIDVENNSISTYLKEEPLSLNSTITTDAVSGVVLSHDGRLAAHERGRQAGSGPGRTLGGHTHPRDFLAARECAVE